ncbi:ras-related and estrogen-regulated growth inhibitor-like [Dreissena polymorpha]|nr:ras-related and estrogen-regulated growth inhibitor-like [Dreissena polymorpha]XP_052219372.1 ras-related and estrogen-regulated growth inhibitor-like [Dreissena polymorpha]XP_052219380.1 ras-related and estrogen-regulated growth inhibitor-like [Dreissena polymorpha]XP_052219388.1 ras-related and estrogen-regulated growth inhibitor-like [Dreissena polymorpha]
MKEQDMTSNGGKNKAVESKICILGGPGVGKSALVVRFLTRRFIWEYDPTLECTYKHQTTIDDEPVALEILDTAGQEWTLHREGHVRWADGFVLVYAVNDRNSFEEVANIKQSLDEIKKTNVQCVLVGNKIDLLHEVRVPYTEGERLANDWACAFFETSASDGGDEIYELFHELHREIRRRKLLETKPRRRSSAHQMRNVFTKMFKTQTSKVSSPS